MAFGWKNFKNWQRPSKWKWGTSKKEKARKKAVKKISGIQEDVRGRIEGTESYFDQLDALAVEQQQLNRGQSLQAFLNKSYSIPTINDMYGKANIAGSGAIDTRMQDMQKNLMNQYGDFEKTYDLTVTRGELDRGQQRTEALDRIEDLLNQIETTKIEYS